MPYKARSADRPRLRERPVRADPPVSRSHRAMEPPGTAGAPGAAGRPWEEAKAFYDSLAPKKKPKSVRAPRCPRPRGEPAPLGARPFLPASPSPSGPLGSLSECPISCRCSGVLLGVSSLCPLWNPLGAPCPPASSGSPCVSLFFPGAPISIQVSPGSLQVPPLLCGITHMPDTSLDPRSLSGFPQVPECPQVPPGLRCPCRAAPCPTSCLCQGRRPCQGQERWLQQSRGTAESLPGVSQGERGPCQARLLGEIRGKACVI